MKTNYNKLFVLNKMQASSNIKYDLTKHLFQKMGRDFEQQTKIVFSGENLFYKINIINILSFFEKVFHIRLSYFKKMLPFFIKNIQFGYIRKDLLKLVFKSLKNNDLFLILTNNIKHKNIFNLPYFINSHYLVTNQFQDFIKIKKINSIAKKFCCIVISNESNNDRIAFFRQLSKYKKVDCYGKTPYTNSDNAKLTKDWTGNHQLFQEYKFVICFENSFAEEYITEKLTNAMIGGSIPIYRGASNISEYFNTQSFINYEDYGKSYKKMIAKIIELDNNDKKYREFYSQPWMTEQNQNNIENKVKKLEVFLKEVIREEL